MRSFSLFIRVIEGHWWIHVDRAGAKWRGHKAIHDRGDINANCALKIREVPLVLLLVIWPVDEALVEIVYAHCDGSLLADYSGGYHGVCRDLCGCGALFTFIST